MVEGDDCCQCLVSRRFSVVMAMLLMTKLTPGSGKWYFDDENVKTNFRRTWAGRRKLTLRTTSRRGHFSFDFRAHSFSFIHHSLSPGWDLQHALSAIFFAKVWWTFFFVEDFQKILRNLYLHLSVTLRTLLRPTKPVEIAAGYHGAPDFISWFLISAGS